MTGAMTMLATTSVAAALAIGSLTAAHTGTAAQHHFAQSVQEYMDVRALALDGLEPVGMTSDLDAIGTAVDARAAAIQQARADARQGDIFTADVGPILREAIGTAISAHGISAAALAAGDGGDDEEPPPARVNGRFMWRSAIATPPSVLAVLPPLPDALQYRFVGADLALVDIDANLIVDVLPRALSPTPTSSGSAARR